MSNCNIWCHDWQQNPFLMYAFVIFYMFLKNDTNLCISNIYTLLKAGVQKFLWFIIINITINYKTSKKLEEQRPKIWFLVDKMWHSFYTFKFGQSSKGTCNKSLQSCTLGYEPQKHYLPCKKNSDNKNKTQEWALNFYHPCIMFIFFLPC